MLVENLKTLLATDYAFMLKCQFFHWNVEGPNFLQLHDFFEKIYEDIEENSIDQTAEMIRMLDEYAPGSMERFVELSLIPGQLRIPKANLMLKEAFDDCEIIIDHLKTCFESAETENNQGAADFVSSRIDAVKKHRWMIKSFMREDRA